MYTHTYTHTILYRAAIKHYQRLPEFKHNFPPGNVEIKQRSLFSSVIHALSRKDAIFRRFRKQDVFLTVGKGKRHQCLPDDHCQIYRFITFFAFTATIRDPQSAIREAAHFHCNKIITIPSFYARVPSALKSDSCVSADCTTLLHEIDL